MQRYLSAFLIVGIFLFGSINQGLAESKGDLESTVEQAIAVRNTGDTAIALELYAKDVKYNLIDQVPSQLNGVNEIMEYYNFLRVAYPDMKYEIKHLTVDGNKVIAQNKFTGTNTGPRGDAPPTNKKVTFSSVSIFYITNGEISQVDVYTNKAAIFRQLGMTEIPTADSK